MVMWFGFDWQSKAAVVVIMTFFPMLVNTVAGLTAASHIEKDMMRTYAASYWQTLFKLRLPAAMPFIFNALKINSTLALIGAIVAELRADRTFGTQNHVLAPLHETKPMSRQHWLAGHDKTHNNKNEEYL